jgi:hypothetical protein
MPGELIIVRGMPGKYHLRCVANAREAWEKARGKSLLSKMLERAR